MNQEQQITMLNTIVKIKVAPSKLHGVGVFAIRFIPKGQKLFADMFPKPFVLSSGNLSKLFPEVREFLLERWPQIFQGKGFMYPDTFIQAFCNHCDDPNYDAISDLTMKDIQAGEEVTENYRDIPNYLEVYPWLKVINTPSSPKKKRGIIQSNVKKTKKA